MSTQSVFRPRHQPAQAIYDAFQAEATKRRSRSVDEWVAAEHQAVWKAACDAAEHLGLPPPTMEQVTRAETCARGHVDYGAKWAYGIVESMNRSGRAAAVPRGAP